MKLMPATTFAADGVLKGNIIALDDAGEPLGWECAGNWSNPGFREKAALGLSESVGINLEQAKAAIGKVLKVARQSALDASPRAEAPPVMTARWPGLIDLVDVGNGQAAFLFVEEGQPKAVERVSQEGQPYVPPQGPCLSPILPLPRYSEVRRHFVTDTDLRLYRNLPTWHQKVSNLGPAWRYNLLALFDLHTWLSDKLAYSPFLIFQSKDPERGKTRSARGVAWVSYRGYVTEILNEANLFRWADAFGLTLMFDVLDLWKKAERKGAEDLILSRFDRNGPKAARVLDPAAGAFADTRYFDVYGPTIMALNELPPDPVLSRSVVIVPPESRGKYPDVTPADALEFKERLCAFRARHLAGELPKLDKPAQGRLGDILLPLAQIAALIGAEPSADLVTVVGELEGDRRRRQTESSEAELIQAILKCAGTGQIVDGKVANLSLTGAFNEGRREKDQLSPEALGKRLTGLGFRACSMPDRTRGRHVDEDLLVALARKFGLDDELEELRKRGLLTTVETVEPSHTALTQIATVGSTVQHNRRETVELQPQSTNDSATVSTVTGGPGNKQNSQVPLGDQCEGEL
ncbi:MAG: hypothetical protein HYX87_09275 [Chloroflexi bacterium]|nr:hypothetical protein [Chloroflexota bacterium]